MKEQGKFVKTEDAPDSLSLYEETTSCTNNPLKPFDSHPQVSDNYHLLSLTVKIKNIVSLHYGNIGCQVFIGGMHNYIHFWPKNNVGIHRDI